MLSHLLKYQLSSSQAQPINFSLGKFYSAIMQFQYKCLQYLENCGDIKLLQGLLYQLIYFLNIIQSVL